VKSVSSLWAVAEPAVAAVIERAHQAAVNDALRIQLGERHLYQLQPPQDRLGQLSMVSVEGSGQRLRQIRDLLPHPTLRHLGQLERLASPSIIAASIARASRVVSRIRSPIS
jgi:hypothetical protein